MWRLLLEYYDAAHGLEWQGQSADTSLCHPSRKNPPSVVV